MNNNCIAACRDKVAAPILQIASHPTATDLLWWNRTVAYSSRLRINCGGSDE